MTDFSLQTAQLHNCFQRVHAGDGAASEELLRATSSRLERLVRRMLKDFPNVRRWADTEDVFQGAILRLLRSLRQLDPPPATLGDFLGLAAAHIRRELLDLARSSGSVKRHGDVPCPTGGADERFDLPDPADEGDELDRWQHFHEEVEKLLVEEREVVGLRFYHGWAEKDIAELFGVTERTVRRRWVTGCARLGTVLGAELPTP